MKKFIVTLATLTVICWGYFIYMNRNRYLYKLDDNSITDYTERVRAEKDLEAMKVRYGLLKAQNDSLIALLSNSDPSQMPEPDKVTELNREIGDLRSENDELRRELDSRKSAPKETASTEKPKKKHEKTIPIARNTRAIELQRYLTELYGNR